MKTKDKKSIKGISLIVLVITIIVIIILATAIIVTLLSNNPMNEANKARFENDRDNMQSIFTNTVAKVMAQKQTTMNIKASALNTVTSGVNTATGDANYTLNNVENEENANGRIIFDNKENTQTEYYTGKQLPIYKSGETKWYVDDEGIISLKVGDKVYGEGKIVNGIKITATVVESEEYIKTKAKVRIEVTYEDELQNVIFNNETITEFEKQEKVYIVEREVTENGTYEIVANGENGATSKTSIEVNQIEVLNSNIQIKSTVTPSSDYVKATMGIEITFNGEVESIKINGESVTVPVKNGGKYVISKEVLENGEYKIEVKAKDGTTNKVIVKVTDLTEDMEIWNRADMESFRDKVNSGRTFENKTATVMADIDLAGNQSNQWVSINTFAGTFNGNYKKIKNLYINNNNNSLNGLFGSIKKTGKVEKVILDNCQISNTMYATNGLYVGGICAKNFGIISQCKVLENSNLLGTQTFFSHDVYIGAIAGQNSNKVIECVNKSQITANQSTNNSLAVIGGIVGHQTKSDALNITPEIQYCYNTGTLISTISGACLMGGIVGYNYLSNVKDCYQVGGINNSGGNFYRQVAAIVGKNESNTIIENVFHLNSMTYAYNNCSGETIISSIQMGSMSSQQMQSNTLVNSLNRNNISKFVKVSNAYPILEWEQNN